MSSPCWRGAIEIFVDVDPRYAVRVGPRCLELVREFIGDRACAVISDERVAPLYFARLGLDAPLLELERGEASKSLANLGRALEFLAEAGLDRDSIVVALGGGVVGDLAGLAASLYMRGIAIVQCPTTLLAQVDASVGGKTAIDLEAGKNLAGTFHQPSAVFADTSALATLDDDEFRSGIGEVVKSALLDGDDACAWLDRRAAALASRDETASTEAVERSIRLKARIVASDPRERGPRKALNLGHTFAHAIELASGYGTIPHGVAVAVGVRLALELANDVGVLADRDLPARLDRWLAALALESSLDALRRRHRVALEPQALFDAMRLDKKGSRGAPRFVLLAKAGEPRLDVAVDPARVLEVLA
jgi:3-dehydroquinate synthase